MEKLSDDMLDNVCGGVGSVEIKYNMDDDPMFQKFSKLYNNEKSENSNGMDSRAEFLSSFRQWVNDGMPDSLKGRRKQA